MHLLSALLPLALSVLPQTTVTPDPASAGPRNVAVVVYHGVELLDFAGPAEVFTVAQGTNGPAFNVFTVSSTRDSITSQGFLSIRADHTYTDCPPADIVVVPGGGIPAGDPELQRFLRARAQESELVFSVCNGALLLAGAQLLDGREVTSHRSALASLQLVAPDAKVLENRRFVDEGDLMTAAGISAGIDGALHVVERLVSSESAKAAATYMEYDWRPTEIAALHAEPGQPVVDERLSALQAMLAAKDVAAAALVQETYAQQDKPLSEVFLNRMGYALKNAGRTGGAQRLFELVAHLHPASANACDSLAELHETLGNRAEAELWTRRTLEYIAEAPETMRAMLLRTADDRLKRLKGIETSGGYRCPPCSCTHDSRTFSEAGACPDAGCGMQLVPVAAASGPAAPETQERPDATEG